MASITIGFGGWIGGIKRYKVELRYTHTLLLMFQETQKLQKKQAWYQQNQVSMTKDDEESYLEYCSQAMFRIHILELRLNRYDGLEHILFCVLRLPIVKQQRPKTKPTVGPYLPKPHFVTFSRQWFLFVFVFQGSVSHNNYF